MKKSWSFVSIAIILVVVLTAMIGIAGSASAATICSPATAISVHFAEDDDGDFYYDTSTVWLYITSYIMTTVEFNGTAYTNIWVASSSIAPVNGTYTIHYNSAVAWGHFEIGAPCGGATAIPTNTPTRTPTRTLTPAISNTPTR